jgi:hypothetical protein
MATIAVVFLRENWLLLTLRRLDVQKEIVNCT